MISQGMSFNHQRVYMKFCSECSHPISRKIPEGDNRLRYVCDNCGTIFYENPKLVVGTVPFFMKDNEPHVLLCKRGIQPRHGYWTLPAGFMENGETVEEGAKRETEEEAGAHININRIFTLIDVPHVNQVHVFYIADMLDQHYEVGVESLEVNFFTEKTIPWDEIAFPTVAYTLKAFFADYHQYQHVDAFTFHEEVIDKKI